MNLNNILNLEKLNCIEIHKSITMGFGVKSVIFKIKDSNFFIKVKYWRGDEFYSYDANDIQIIDIDSLKYPNDMHRYNSWSLQDCLRLLPESAQKEIIMNLDLFMGL